MSKLRTMTTGLLIGLTLAVVAAPIVTAAPPSGVHSGRPLAATLTGAAEVPGPGDVDGSGVATAAPQPGPADDLLSTHRQRDRARDSSRTSMLAQLGSPARRS